MHTPKRQHQMKKKKTLNNNTKKQTGKDQKLYNKMPCSFYCAENKEKRKKKGRARAYVHYVALQNRSEENENCLGSCRYNNPA